VHTYYSPDQIPPEMRSIDLHTHTTASDGQHAPTELVKQARQVGLSAIAITDHDTTAGVKEAVAAGICEGVEVIAGIELSGDIDKGQCHLLGYCIDPSNTQLQHRLEYVVEMRNSRNARIVAKMRDELGFDVTLEEVEHEAGGDIVARPHFARVLVNKRYASSMQEAFDVYLGKGGKAYVDRFRISAEEAIALVHGAGGVCFLAHPNNLKMDDADTEAYIRGLVGFGLDGIEARYNRHTAEDNAKYLSLASRLNILTSGGSDYHGIEVKKDVRLGCVEGELPAPESLLAAIKDAAAKHR
jgi:3',5'-nucleoside bisphosphate phosphatase